MKSKLDKIGNWSEVKLDIIREYATAYSVIFSAPKQRNLHHAYIDAFAGPGTHISKTTGKFIPGSPLNALAVNPPFEQYFLIDLDGDKVARLRRKTRGQDNVKCYRGDCNEILLDKVFPSVRWEDYWRALCILDPYGLHLNWEVVQKAGQMRSIEVFLNFPVMDMNMNVLRRNPDRVASKQIERMNAFWGDDSWREASYVKRPTLFGPREEKATSQATVEAYAERLRTVAGFEYVPDPMPMRNTKGAIVYYLLFASRKPVAKNIVQSIFKKYRTRSNA